MRSIEGQESARDERIKVKWGERELPCMCVWSLAAHESARVTQTAFRDACVVIKTASETRWTSRAAVLRCHTHTHTQQKICQSSQFTSTALVWRLCVFIHKAELLSSCSLLLQTLNLLVTGCQNLWGDVVMNDDAVSIHRCGDVMCAWLGWASLLKPITTEFSTQTQ